MNNEIFDDWLSDNKQQLMDDFIERNLDGWLDFIKEEFNIWVEETK